MNWLLLKYADGASGTEPISTKYALRIPLEMRSVERHLQPVSLLAVGLEYGALLAGSASSRAITSSEMAVQASYEIGAAEPDDVTVGAAVPAVVAVQPVSNAAVQTPPASHDFNAARQMSSPSPHQSTRSASLPWRTS